MSVGATPFVARCGERQRVAGGVSYCPHNRSRPRKFPRIRDYLSFLVSLVNTLVSPCISSLILHNTPVSVAIHKRRVAGSSPAFGTLNVLAFLGFCAVSFAFHFATDFDDNGGMPPLCRFATQELRQEQPWAGQLKG